MNQKACCQELAAEAVRAGLECPRKSTTTKNSHPLLGWSAKLPTWTSERSDKIRTYRCQDGLATDHRSNRKVALTQVLAGKLELLC